MPLRVLIAAFMAAILAALGVMIARAVLDPPLVPDIDGREAFLIRHLAVGLPAALAAQLLFRLRGLPTMAGALGLGLAGFIAAALLPWLAQPAAGPGLPGLGDLSALGAWLLTAIPAAVGLWLLRPGSGALLQPRRVAGAVLVLAPLLLADGGADPLLAAAPDDPLAETGPGVVVAVVLEAVFWLMLGIFSLIAARKVVLR